MKILIAEDDSVTRRALEAALVKWGYDALVTSDGNEAWNALQQKEKPKLAILDWMMPGMDGIEICRKVREIPDFGPLYIIMLTVRERNEDIVAGLQAGADDYVTKPFEYEEPRARVQVGIRIIRLEADLRDRVKKLECALSKVNQLQGLLPICTYRRKVRDDQNYWHQVEIYVTEHSDAQFSHTYCPECHNRFVKPQLESRL